MGSSQHIMAEQEEKPKEKELKKEEEEEKKNDDDKAANDAKKPNVDFSGTWKLKTNEGADAYYKSEGWGWIMRKAVPTMGITQIIEQKGNHFKIHMLVNVPAVGTVADQTNESVIGSGDEIEYKDKDGPCCATAKWNEEGTEIISDVYRKDDKKRTYKLVRKFADDSKIKMICLSTNHLGKTLIQTYELQK